MVPLLLEPLLAGSCRLHPEIELEIAASEEMTDIAKAGFDAGIRMGQPIAPDMVAIRLTPPFPFVTVASPAYLAERGTPKRLDDLRGHACIRMRRASGAVARWTFLDGNKPVEAAVTGPLITHDYPTVLGAAIMDVGLAQVPGPVAAGAIAAGQVMRVLARFETMTPGVFLYHPGKRQVLPKLRAFIDYVREHPPAV